MRPIVPVLTPAITSGLSGIRAATARLDRAASEISSAGLPTTGDPRPALPPADIPAVGAGAVQRDDLVGNMVQTRLSVIEVAANARSVDAAIQAYRSVLEIGREQR